MKKRPAIVAISLLCAAVLVLGSMSVWLYFEYESPEELAVKALAAALADDLEKANAVIESQNADNDTLRARESALQKEVEELEYKVNLLIESDVASDAYQQILLDEISKLKNEAELSADRVKELEDLVVSYEKIAYYNISYNVEKVSELILLMSESNRPSRTVVIEKMDDATGEVVDFTVEERPGKLSFYYKDLTTGYVITYNDSEIMYAASVIKAPYIFSLLSAVVEFENSKHYFDPDGNALYDEEGNPLFQGEHPNLDDEGRIIYLPGEEKYDLSRVWSLNKEEMMQEGSGVLKDKEDGFQLTYLELIEYALKYSDNIAFAELRKMFGYEEYYRMAEALGVKGHRKGYMQLSADDAGRFFDAIYTFIEGNVTYGSIMKDVMIHSIHSIMITPAVSPSVTAHKYGWDIDAYHDAAIVYDENPYLLVIMTDYDDGGTAANAYIHKITRLINEIHREFHEEKQQ
ncbi:MAG: serine hydrolase [Clostridia bacterium]|nr:serine hydrolase [Clostridia bacterium]